MGREVGSPTSALMLERLSADKDAKAFDVEGFRGIGKKARLDLTPGPGLTLVVGRNGSGKSSFAEALELLLTRETYRWKGRTKVWREGWRNLHHAKAKVEAEVLLEGEKGATRITETWADGADLDDGQTEVQVHGKPKADTKSLGWDGPLETYRPFLSYSELGSMLEEGPAAQEAEAVLKGDTKTPAAPELETLGAMAKS